MKKIIFPILAAIMLSIGTMAQVSFSHLIFVS